VHRSRDRVVVITGATSGVGRATARAFAREGARVALLARGSDGLEAAAAEVRREGGTALPIKVDVANAEQVEAAAAQVERELGPIDVWVNDAMTTVFAEFADIEPDEFRRATEVTYLGSVWGARAALTRMLPRDRGTIVQVGSALAFRGIPLQSAYCGSKHALQGFVESVRCELRHRHSKVVLTTVHLPGLNTPQFDHCRSKMPHKPQPVPPIFQPEVAADAIVWASRRRRRTVYVGLPTVITILGNKVAPLLAEIYLARTAYSGQQTAVPEPGPRPGNLFEPSSGDPGAHGGFDGRAHSRSVQLAFTKHRVAAGIAASSAAVVAAAAKAASHDRHASILDRLSPRTRSSS
jgi:NAD(P)-dependent dehydrogenase (short-subunit alcohol dehydrogenase family)